MAAWRRKVIALFPDLRHEVQCRDFSIYMVYFELLPRVRIAHEQSDLDTLSDIYGFAEWCFEQKAKDLWNSAAVAFYEHLFDLHRTFWPEIVRWLPPMAINSCWGLWEFRLLPEDVVEIRRLIDSRRSTLYTQARLVSRLN